MTDGNLSPDGRHIDLTSKDRDLLRTFLDCLGVRVKIGTKKSGYTGGPCYRVQIGNIKLFKWLLKIGLKPNKTKKLNAITVPDHLLADFLRGHLDGDGHFYVYQDHVYPNSTRLYVRFNAFNKKHLFWLRGKVKKAIGINGRIASNSNIWKLEYAKKESLALIPFIYYNRTVPCLRRKRRLIEFVL